MISSLSEALAERGYDTLTPVQEAVSAPELADRDLLVSAQTGSGKTVGFGLAIAPTLLGEAEAFGPAAEPQALVVAPTRELAFQVRQELSWLYARTGAVLASCVGGMDARQERRALERGAHVVVGTPGRLRDHIERGALDLGQLRAVVLDEADEMLDLGFREDLEFILGSAPEERRTLLFSATVPQAIVAMARQFQKDAQRVNTLAGTDQHADISYQAIRVAAQDSEHAIFNMLRYHHDKGAIVFANTRAAVNHLTARLANRGLSTVCLSGELSQAERSHALQAMRDGRARVCVATDVAARGIDLPNLNLVIHADLPTNTESLLHRSGRTGRAGRKGISALIVPPRATKKAERLLKWAKISAEWTLPPAAEDIRRQDEDRLLAAPDWDMPAGEEETAFAARLMAERSPEEIAVACLRLHKAGLAAPEDLMAPDARGAARGEPKPAPRDFGPSRWIALSVGRAARAEPRWLLPLLCRAGNLDKADIGAIRVQQDETFVELSEARLDPFLATLGADGQLEEGVSARALDGAPDLSGPRPEKRTDKGGDKRSDKRPARQDGPRPGKRAETPAPRKPAPGGETSAAAQSETPRGTGPRPEGSASDRRRDDSPRAGKDYAGKPRTDRKRADWKGADRKGADDKPRGDKPHHARSRADAAPIPGARDDKAARRKDARPAGRHAPHERRKGPKGPEGGKPGKARSWSAGKGKPAAGTTRADARDSSKRFNPGKPGKAGGKPGGASRPRLGANDAPRRGKR